MLKSQPNFGPPCTQKHEPNQQFKISPYRRNVGLITNTYLCDSRKAQSLIHVVKLECGDRGGVWVRWRRSLLLLLFFPITKSPRTTSIVTISATPLLSKNRRLGHRFYDVSNRLNTDDESEKEESKKGANVQICWCYIGSSPSLSLCLTCIVGFLLYPCIYAWRIL